MSIEKFTRKVVEEFPDPLTTTAESSAVENLFTMCDGDDPRRRPLPEERAQQFHRTVAQLLFLAVRPRRDCRTAVAFLTSCVSDPEEDNWAKLKRVLRYLKCNQSLALTLEASNLGLIHWHVNASFAVHAGMIRATPVTACPLVVDPSSTRHRNRNSTRSA